MSQGTLVPYVLHRLRVVHFPSAEVVHFPSAVNSLRGAPSRTPLARALASPETTRIFKTSRSMELKLAHIENMHLPMGVEVSMFSL